jgi:hypothetical protein
VLQAVRSTAKAVELLCASSAADLLKQATRQQLEMELNVETAIKILDENDFFNFSLIIFNFK